MEEKNSEEKQSFDKPYLTSLEACQYLGISRVTLHFMKKRNRNGFADKVVVRVGSNRLRYHKESLDLWLKESGKGVIDEPKPIPE